MRKKLMAMLLSFAMILTLVPTMAFATYTWSGTGTAADPYQIGMLDELKELATEVNGGTAFEGTYFKLTANIGDATTPFTTPIGDYTNQFKGNFDGDGHTVTLNISGSSYLGLFGCLNGGSIKNVTTAGTVADTSKSVTGNGPAAGVCALNIGGTIENCVNKAAVSCKDYCKYMGGICGKNEGGTINGCSNTALVKAWGYNVQYFGGICGQNYTGSILNCVNSGEVKAIAYEVNSMGGICGLNGGVDSSAATADAIIANCVNNGKVTVQGNKSYEAKEIGGICGRNNAGTHKGMVVNCFSTARMSYPTAGDTPVISYCGGVVGYNWENADNGKAIVSNCYYDTTVTNTLATVAVGSTNFQHVTDTLGLTTAQMQAASGETSGEGWDGTALVDLLNAYTESDSYPATWYAWKVEADAYPTYKFAAKIGSTGYASLDAALEAAKAGDTVTLLEDVELTEALTVNKTLTIDLNNKTLTAAEDKDAICVTGSSNTLTVKGGTIVGSTSDDGAALDANAGTIQAENVTITGRTAFTVINAGAINAKDCNISSNFLYYADEDANNAIALSNVKRNYENEMHTAGNKIKDLAVADYAVSGQKLIGGTAGDTTYTEDEPGEDASKISVRALVKEATEMSPEVQAKIASLPGNVIPIDVTLYYNNVAVEGAKLNNTIKVIVPFTGDAAKQYSVGHWNGTSFDLIPAEYDDGAKELSFFADAFSPYVIIDGVAYCEVHFNSGDGFAFKDFANVTAPLVGLAVKTADYSFKLDVDAGYTLVKVLNNGTELPLGTPTGTGTKTYSFTLVNVTEVKNIEAYVVKDGYLTFDVNGGTGSVPASVAKAAGTYTDIDAPAPTKAGFTFKGWLNPNTNTILTVTGGKFDSVVIPAEGLTLVAQWEQDSYTVAFDAQGGNGEVPATQSYTVGTYVTLTGLTMTKDGYTFAGWRSSEDNVIYKQKYKVPAMDVTLTAVWVENGVVTFDVNGGTGVVPAPTACAKDTTVTVAKTTVLTKTGYKFLGWLRSDTNELIDNTAADKTFTMPATGVMLVAQWEVIPSKYTVTYNYTGVTDSGTYDKNDQVTVLGTGVTKDVVGDTAVTGKKVALLGWTCADVEYGTRLLKPGAKFAMPEKNVILDPVWAYRVNFNFSTELANITNLDTIGETYNNNIVYGGNDPVYKAYYGGRFGETPETVVLPADPTRNGYTFAGWKNSVDGETYFAGQQFFVTDDTILTAQWNGIVERSVNYELDGGTGTFDAQEFVVGSQATVRTGQPTKTGNKFACWKDLTTGIAYNPGQTFTMPDRNMTLTAQWGKTYTVKFNLNDGGHSDNAPISDRTVAEDSLLAVPTLMNTSYTYGGVTYYFNGWKNQKSGEKWWFDMDKVNDGTTVSNTLTLVAQWDTEKLYTVIFDDNLTSPLDDYVTINGERTYVSDVFKGFEKVENVASGAILHNVNKVPTFARVDYILGTDATADGDWYLDAACTESRRFEPLASLADNHVEEFVKDGVLTLYAKWTANYDSAEDVVIDENSLTNEGTYNTYYSDFIEASHAINPYNSCRVYRNFHIVDGDLPTGLYLNERTGEVYGVPTVAGTYTFTVVMGSDEYVNTQGYTVWDPISAEQEFTVEIKPNELTIDHKDSTTYTKVYGENDPANMLKNATNLTATLSQTTNVAPGYPALTDANNNVTINYTYAANNTDRTNYANSFVTATTKAVLESNLKFANDLDDTHTVPETKQDVLGVSFDRMAGEDVGQYKYCLPVANVTGDAVTAGAYTVVIPADFAATTMPIDHRVAAKYLFKIEKRAADMFTPDKDVLSGIQNYVYGELTSTSPVAGTYEADNDHDTTPDTVSNGLARNTAAGVLDTLAATVVGTLTDAQKSTAGYLKANTTGYKETDTDKALVFATTNGATPLGTASATTTANYKANTPTYTLVVAKKDITATATGKQVDVYTGATIDVTKMDDFAALTLNGIVTSDAGTDDVSIDTYTVVYDLDLDNNGSYEETNLDAATAAGKLQTVAANAGTYGVKVKFSNLTLTGEDEGNYNLTPATADTTDGEAKLVVTVRSYGGGGGGSIATYKITCGKGVTADKKTAAANATITLTVAEGYNTPVVTDEDGKTVTVKASGSKYTFKMPASDVTVSVTAEAPIYSNCPHDETCVLEQFTDLKNGAWYHDGIHYCLDNGYMKGMTETTFGPGLATTRAMIVTMLARLSGYNVNGTGSEWYLPSMEWAVANGISDGTMMTANITREQLATMLYRYAVEIAEVDVDELTADTNTLSYEDVFTISDWASEGTHFCLATGVIGGYEDGTIRPQAEATRAEVATMFMRFCVNVLGK